MSFVLVFPAIGEVKNIRFSDAAVSKKIGAADPISAYLPVPQLVEGNGSNPL